MAVRWFFTIGLFFSGMAGVSGQQKQGFDKPVFYSIMASGDTAAINNELAIVVTALIPEKEAYKGALMMKKAGLLTKPASKLKIFKAGCILFESALKRDSTNGEYHFLRLSIQEHAPRILGYNKDLERDRNFIHRSFKEMSPEVQKAIMDYSKNSKILHRGDIDPGNY